MTEYRVSRSQLKGEISPPSSKSHTNRAILFASLADGLSRIDNHLESPDAAAMIDACQALGAQIHRHASHLEILGTNFNLSCPKQVIDAGNSGQVLRFIAALASLLSDPIELTGDLSIQTNRVVRPLLQGLQDFGATAYAKHDNGFAPIIVQGPWRHTEACIDGQDSQPVSGLLMAMALADFPCSLTVKQPGEHAWVEMTLAWFRRLGIRYDQQSYEHYQLYGKAYYPGFQYTVPADFSSAAFPLVAALITHSELKLKHLDFDDCQGDKKIFRCVSDLEADITIANDVLIRPSPNMLGAEIDLNPMIDALPILAVLACHLKTPTVLYGAEIAKNKESNRIEAMYQELSKMGAKLELRSDGLKIFPSTLKGARVLSHHDHRVAMALTVAGLAADGVTIVEHVECIAKSYPNFLQDFLSIGAQIDA